MPHQQNTVAQQASAKVVVVRDLFNCHPFIVLLDWETNNLWVDRLFKEKLHGKKCSQMLGQFVIRMQYKVVSLNRSSSLSGHLPEQIHLDRIYNFKLGDCYVKAKPCETFKIESCKRNLSSM